MYTVRSVSALRSIQIVLVIDYRTEVGTAKAAQSLVPEMV